MNYYNEINPVAAKTLRLLIDEGVIAPGDVDTRSIEDVTPNDLQGYTQCHFFTGIGGWPIALRQAGWPDDEPVWTGSCPCQPFSKAGKGLGFDDPRHLWPSWRHLISVRKPDVIYGEQVATAGGIEWLGVVQHDMEAEGYAYGPLVLPACSVGSPQLRHRLFFVGDRHFQGLEGQSGDDGKPGWPEATPTGPITTTSVLSGPWSGAEWLPYRDGVLRANQPGTLPLAHVTPSFRDEVHAIGNAIVIELASQFITAHMSLRRTA